MPFCRAGSEAVHRPAELSFFDYQYEMAQTALTRGDYEEALAFARRAVSLDGGSEAARLLETDILCQMGQSEEASRILEELIAHGSLR